ncbi:MAG: D-alanyl-D-alanine carboxypeptidase [Peptococcaceae bacterium]|nr:D-alanyl-D-alanine carboxypeptidase [Peptococcaceae bacterium]
MRGNILLGKRGYISFLIGLIIFSFTLAQAAWAATETDKAKKTKDNTPAVLETTAQSAVVLEPVTNRIIYEKEPHKQLPMASVTKLMTLLLATEAVDQGKFKLNDKVITSENAWEMGGSQIYLEPGEEMSLWELLLAVGLQSANDASVAVAEHIAGSEEAFVQAMNDKAASLGLVNTHFVNCHGLTADNHYTSAYDMSIILKEGLKSPLFRQITATKEYDLRGGAFKLWNTNKMLWWYDGADAGKTGWTEAANYCLASSAERNGMRLICTVLGTAEPKSHFRESTKLLDYGFARFKAVNFAEQGAIVGTVRVSKGKTTSVEALAAEKVGVVVPKGEDKGYESKVELPEYISAPVRKGQEIGSYVVTKNVKEALRVKLVAKEDVAKASIMQQMRRVIDSVY